MDIIRHIASDNIGVYHIPSAPNESDSAIRLMLCSTSPRPIDMAVACLGLSSAVMNPPISTLKPRIMYEKLYVLKALTLYAIRLSSTSFKNMPTTWLENMYSPTNTIAAMAVTVCTPYFSSVLHFSRLPSP